MKMKCVLWACMVVFLVKVECDVVTYDGRSLIVNNTRMILVSGSIHYPRSTPEMWEDLINKAKLGGIDVIDTYVFWNGHELSRGQYNFEGRFDLVRFVKTIHKAGLYAHLRIGPYVCAEWNFGGFPVWLKYVPGISFRTDNEPFKNAMQSFTQKIVDLMKSEKLYASQGGPIILSQIENEYGPLSQIFGDPGPGLRYTEWAANMAVNMDTGVPWVMCKQDNAPDPVINTCNGFYCDAFTPNKPYKPKIWTEAWTGWFTEFGGPTHVRPAQDMAFAVAKFVSSGGSLVNYYMYHGGTNFGRTAGGPFITTSYDYNAPLDEYGEKRQPLYDHLRQLHRAIKRCEQTLLSAEMAVTYLGSLHQVAYVYNTNNGHCAAFLSNYDVDSTVRVFFNGMNYTLPPWSISILPDCKNVVFNTAKITVQTTKMEMVPSGVELFSWETYNEQVSDYDDSLTMTPEYGLKEQISLTRDSSDYLWSTTTVYMNTSENPTLIVQSSGHALHVFVNGWLAGSVSGTTQSRKCVFNEIINLRRGLNRIALLNVAIGLPNIGPKFETREIGVLGNVALLGLTQGKMDLASQKWAYQVGLKGESMNLASPNSLSSVEWTQSSLQVQNRKPLTWYKATFKKPTGKKPLALDMRSMGKGQVWINGQSIGRYWSLNAVGNCVRRHYTGKYRPEKGQTGCGKLTQRWYHVPLEWLKPEGNLLVIFEELGGDHTKITLNKRTTASVCADVAEYHPNFEKWQEEAESIAGGHVEAKFYNSKAKLDCGQGNRINAIKFASFGTPLGTCGNFTQGPCHATLSPHILEQKCLGKRRCQVAISVRNFGVDPCPKKLKRLSVDATCGPRK